MLNIPNYIFNEIKNVNKELYLCRIKSHSEAPDFETEVMASSKNDAAKKIMNEGLAKAGWDKETLMEHIVEARKVDELIDAEVKSIQ